MTVNGADRLDAAAGGLLDRLAATPVETHERDTAAVFAELRRTRAAAMLIPRDLGGGGVSAADAVAFQIALGALAPSAAIATTMHHYKIAALAGVAATGDDRARSILGGLADGPKLLASGGAESTPGRDLRTLGSRAVRVTDGYLVTALKRPCSLSSSMDMLSLMVELRGAGDAPDGFAQAFVPAGAPGLQRSEFWRSPVFLGAESHEVRLTDVRIPVDHVFPLRGAVGDRFAAECYLWFQLLIGAAYLGVARCVAGTTGPDRRATARGWAGAVADLDRLATALLAAARMVDDEAPLGVRLNAAVRARDLVEDDVGGIGGRLLRAAGGGSFARTGLFTTLAGALHAIAFHPPQRGSREGVGLALLDPDVKERG